MCRRSSDPPDPNSQACTLYTSNRAADIVCLLCQAAGFMLKLWMGEPRDFSDALGAVSLSEYGGVLLHRTIERVVASLYRTFHGPLRAEWVRCSRNKSDVARAALAYPVPKHSLSEILFECSEEESERRKIYSRVPLSPSSCT